MKLKATIETLRDRVRRSCERVFPWLADVIYFGLDTPKEDDFDRSNPPPVFIIHFNKPKQLKACVDSIARILPKSDVIIIDNGSDSDAALIELSELAKCQRVSVSYQDKISRPSDLNKANAVVQRYFKEMGVSNRYVVTDCDMHFGCADENVIEIYYDLLDSFKSAWCCGPMLKISDVDKAYPLYNQLMVRHIDAIYKYPPRRWSKKLPGGEKNEIYFNAFNIDTTFAVHRAGQRFRRWRKGLRVYPPYDVWHLDWYAEWHEPHYKKSASKNIINWSDAGSFSQQVNEVCPRWYWDVEVNGDGKAKVVRCKFVPSK